MYIVHIWMMAKLNHVRCKCMCMEFHFTSSWPHDHTVYTVKTSRLPYLWDIPIWKRARRLCIWDDSGCPIFMICPQFRPCTYVPYSRVEQFLYHSHRFIIILQYLCGTNTHTHVYTHGRSQREALQNIEKEINEKSEELEKKWKPYISKHPDNPHSPIHICQHMYMYMYVRMYIYIRKHVYKQYRL